VRILVIEDDEAIASALVTGLTREGFSPIRAGSAAEALRALPADFILLDLGLPDRDGVDLFESLRDASNAPIIMVTARGSEEERITGLDLGADDYVVKPFGLRELVARINAVLRRTVTSEGEHRVQHLNEVTIDRRTRTVAVDDVEIACTPKEYGILEYLARDPGAVVTRQELLDAVWGPNWFGSTKMIDVHVASLRRKLSSPELIETHRGIGFRLVVA
jgi:two-component system, OmpR family, response regulator RegX3